MLFLFLGGCHTRTCERYQLRCNHLDVERGMDTVCNPFYTYVVNINILVDVCVTLYNIEEVVMSATRCSD